MTAQALLPALVGLLPVLSFLGRLLLRVPVGDFHCGLRAFDREALRSVRALLDTYETLWRGRIERMEEILAEGSASNSPDDERGNR